MIWAILVFLGVPLWLCAAAVAVLVWRNRVLRSRPGNVPLRVRRPGQDRWRRAHGMWVSDVFVWRASPAAWAEDVREVVTVRPLHLDAGDLHRLRKLDHPVAVTLLYGDGQWLDAATDEAHEALLVNGDGLRAG